MRSIGGEPALGAEGDTVIRDSECVGVSFPDFFKTLERLRGGENQEDLRK